MVDVVAVLAGPSAQPARRVTVEDALPQFPPRRAVAALRSRTTSSIGLPAVELEVRTAEPAIGQGTATGSIARVHGLIGHGHLQCGRAVGAGSVSACGPS
jgi:hypothetical protein